MDDEGAEDLGQTEKASRGRARQVWDGVVRRVADIGAQEEAERKQVMRVARSRGPLHAAALLARGELGGPLWQAFYSRLPVLKNRRMLRLLVLTGPWMLGAFFLWFTDWLLANASMFFQLLMIVFLLLLGLSTGALLYGLALRGIRTRVLRMIRGWSPEDLAWYAALIIVLPTVAFAAFTAFLVSHDVIGFRGAESAGPLAFKALETYAWNLTEAIPVLKVPKTLNWKPELTLTTTAGGALVLAYKVLVILPLVQLAGITLVRLFGDAKPEEAPDDRASEEAAGGSAPG